MTKTHKVINSCRTLKQLYSAWNYVELSYNHHQNYTQFALDAQVYRLKINEMTGAVVKNLLDYKAYAEHLLLNGKIDDANDFIRFSELELDKIEKFYKNV